jgi:hypothetical protein
MSRTRSLTIFAVAAGLLVPAIAPARTDDVINVYPPQAWAMYLPHVRATSGLTVLLPSKMRVHVLADEGRFRAVVDFLGKGNYDFTLTNEACTAHGAACRDIVSFSGERETETKPSESGNIKLAKGRRGSFDGGSCTGGGCTPPSITWVERKARYTVYGYVPGNDQRRLTKYVNDAIRSGPR